jgi:predicted nucleic acid-binding protein
LIVDTQIISYCFSGHWEPEHAENVEISSVTASEFLLFHTREDSKVDYYVINPERFGSFRSEAMMEAYAKHAGNSKWAKMGAKRTDSIAIDFANQYQPYRMFGNNAITSIINTKNFNAFKLSISHLEKAKQKMLKKKLEFIFDNNMHCHRISENACNISLDLLSKFEKNIKPKENIKNTINDLLILSTAIDHKKALQTKDKVLAKFAASIYLGKVNDARDAVIVDFTEKNLSEPKINKESKGYINRGWAYSFSKGSL